MSSSPNNLDPIDPKEATEAKLCAYLEGELAPQDRSEIEKYLQSNPQHRELLAELAKTREYLSSLPRESAPPEIAEVFEGHLERSMLLDPKADAGSVVRINRLPQVLLVAAMFAVAAGLGTVIYFALPNSSTSAPKYAVATMPSAPEGSARSIAAPASLPAGSAEELALNAGTQAEKELGVKAKSEPTTAVATVVDEAKSADAGTVAQGTVTDDKLLKPVVAAADAPVVVATPPVAEADSLPSAIPQTSAPYQTASTINPFGIEPNNTVCVLVRTTDPVAASAEVRRYFASNGIRYDILANDPAVANNNYGSIVIHNGGLVGSGGGGGGAMAGEANGARQLSASDSAAFALRYANRNITLRRAGNSDQLRNAGNTQMADSAGNDFSFGAKKKDADAFGGSSPPVSQPIGAEAQSAVAGKISSTQPSGIKNSVDSKLMVPSTQPSISVNQQLFADRAQQQNAQPRPFGQVSLPNGSLDAFQEYFDVDTSNSDVFIARGITAHDAEQLHASLAAQSRSQTAEVYTVASGSNKEPGISNSPHPPGTSPSLEISGSGGLHAFSDSVASGGPTTSPAFAYEIQKDDRLKVTVDQLVGPGVDKTTYARVAEDGMIALPMIEPIRAQGQTPDKLKKLIADKYREDNLISAATVTVTRDTAPATLPATEPALGVNNLSMGSSTPAVVATQLSATQPADAEKIDVVVLVQKTAGVVPVMPAPSAAPSSQPVGESSGK